MNLLLAIYLFIMAYLCFQVAASPAYHWLGALGGFLGVLLFASFLEEFFS